MSVDNIDFYINMFKQYTITHPNLSHIWIDYLELKKRHYEEIDKEQCRRAIERLGKGDFEDLKSEDIIRLLIYKNL